MHTAIHAKMTIAEITTPAMAPPVGVFGVSSGRGAGRPVGRLVGMELCASVGTMVMLSSLVDPVGEEVGLELVPVPDVEGSLDAEELSDMVHEQCVDWYHHSTSSSR